MNAVDLVLRGGLVVTPAGVREADLAVAEEKIVAVEETFSGSFVHEIDARGLHLFPGLIDAHVHFNEPGRTDWEGIETGSRALAAGGGTVFFDMPLNAHPPTIDGESFDLKLAAAARNSLTDFALWGGLVPGNLDRLEELAERGVVGFKAFMSDSGIDDFSCVDDGTLRQGMKRAAGLNLPVAVHAESDVMTRRLARERIAQGRTSVRDYLESRPVAAELDAIRRATDLASETGCQLHVVHVSSGAGVQMISEARARGVDVSAETCPHYLALSAADMEQIGATAKCAPPLREPAEREALWQRVLAGEVATIGSDHSPSPPGMKTSRDFFQVWGGISSVQHTLSILLEEAHHHRGIPLEALAKMLSTGVAARFSLPREKGSIGVGSDADLALVDLGGTFEVIAEELFYRHRHSPYVGRKLRGRVVRTLLRGRTIFQDGKRVATPSGRLVKPLR